MKELHRVALALSKHFSPERINIAALGNIVSQMHWHLIVRHTIDKAWPQPVWGTNYSAYDNNKQFKIIDLMRNEFL
jgi:diadenosine tetraphosphate (Ap4A) HIT family hydrolase